MDGVKIKIYTTFASRITFLALTTSWHQTRDIWCITYRYLYFIPLYPYALGIFFVQPQWKHRTQFRCQILQNIICALTWPVSPFLRRPFAARLNWSFYHLWQLGVSFISNKCDAPNWKLVGVQKPAAYSSDPITGVWTYNRLSFCMTDYLHSVITIIMEPRSVLLICGYSNVHGFVAVPNLGTLWHLPRLQESRETS